MTFGKHCRMVRKGANVLAFSQFVAAGVTAIATIARGASPACWLWKPKFCEDDSQPFVVPSSN